MRNIFAFDVGKHKLSKKKTVYEAIDGQKFRVTGAFGRLDKLNQRYAAAFPEKNTADRICEVSYNLGEICMRLMIFYPIAMILLAFFFFERLNSRPFQTLGLLLLPLLILGLVFLICLLLGKAYMPKTSLRQTNFDAQKVHRDFDKELRKTLGIPENAERVDILYYGYQWRGKKAWQSKSRFGLRFTNLDNLAYLKEGRLCLTDGHELFEIPKSAIVEIRHMEDKGNADMTQWNKKAEPTDASFARYRLRRSGDHYYLPMRAVFQVIVKNRPEDFFFLVPGYDVEALCRVLGMPAPQLPVLPETAKKAKQKK